MNNNINKLLENSNTVKYIKCYIKTTVLIKAIKMLSATNIYCGSDTLYLNTCYIYIWTSFLLFYLMNFETLVETLLFQLIRWAKWILRQLVCWRPIPLQQIHQTSTLCVLVCMCVCVHMHVVLCITYIWHIWNISRMYQSNHFISDIKYISYIKCI